MRTCLTTRYIGGVRRHSLFRQTKLYVYIPERRISYLDPTGNKRKGASFHSIFLKINADRNILEME